MPATIYSGAETLETASGQTVAAVRARFGTALNIPDTANALVDGRPVNGTYVLGEDEELTFSKPTGEKG